VWPLYLFRQVNKGTLALNNNVGQKKGISALERDIPFTLNPDTGAAKS